MIGKGSDLRVARVLHEDDAMVTLEVVKDPDRKMRIEDGDRFWTLLFVRSVGDGHMEAWLPWEDA